MIIVLFHLFYLLGKLVYRRYSAVDMGGKDDKQDDEAHVDVGANSGPAIGRGFPPNVNDDSDEESRAVIRFRPPAYVQRYTTVSNVLADPPYGGKLKKIVDFGCSELGFCNYMKKLVGVEELLFVDIDRATLDMYKDKAKPLLVDFLHRRETPLVMKIFEGSVTQSDKSLEGCDAVVAIELVEHLYPDTLADLPYNIFGFIKPKVAIITTPNADFNVLFTNMTGFRHPDHKFEWTRKEFQDWANCIIKKFPEYKVTFHGICNGPPGSENLGACSQMAVFHKSYDLKSLPEPGTEGLFKSVETYEYPFEVDNRSDEEKILSDAVYFIRLFSGRQDVDNQEEVPLDTLLRNMKNFYISSDQLKEILQNANWSVVDRETGPVVLVPPPSILSDHSFHSSMFDDHEYPPRYDEWDDDPGPPADYFYQRANNDDNDIAYVSENWDSDDESHIHVPVESENNAAQNNSFNTEVANSTTSICPDDVCLDDIETESRSNELDNSALDDSIIISSFSDTKDSDNSETTRNSCSQAQDSLVHVDETNAEEDASMLQSKNMSDQLESKKYSSICSMFLEPSKMSQDFQLDSSADQSLGSIFASPLEKKNIEKSKFNTSEFHGNVKQNLFEKPKYSSSPHVLLTATSKKRKLAGETEKQASSSASSSSNEDLMLRIKDELKDIIKTVNHRAEQTNSYSEGSPASKVVRIGCLPNSNDQRSPDEQRHYTGTIPKYSNDKSLNLSVNIPKESKAEIISSVSSESPPNSWSPEVMDSGYPNSNSPPDLSPEYDLSSIAQDHTSDSESLSIADEPRVGFIDLPEVENRDLANNNLDNEGNNMRAEMNQNINDLRPLMNVLENDLENENDIYVMRNGFPIWLLGILDRANADNNGGNLPMLQPPDENFGE